MALAALVMSSHALHDGFEGHRHVNELGVGKRLTVCHVDFP
jgi:hypothetical protein